MSKPPEPAVPAVQGEIWRVGGRRPRIALILDSAAVIRRRDLLICVLVRDPDELPENLALLAVPITDPITGVIAVSDITHFLKEQYTEYLGRVDEPTLELVKEAVRARFEL